MLSIKSFLTLSALAALLLAGCKPGSVAFTPQESALQTARRSMGPQARLIESTVQVRQTVESGGYTFLLLTFDRQFQGRQEPCLVTYGMQKDQLGAWSVKTGLVDCHLQKVDSNGQVDPPLDIGGGITGGADPDHPDPLHGLGYAAGLVFSEEIQQVRVTWDDGINLSGNVIHGSYLITRKGAVHFKTVEGLGARGEVVYTFNTGDASGK